MQTHSRINITMPDTLLAELNSELPIRKRSEFIVTAAREKIRKVKRSKKLTYAQALMEFKDKYKIRNRPGWENLDSIVNWVNEGRAAANRDYSYIPYGSGKKD